ncbi:hypothetical protein RhiXN_08046 [Rhizoctonia solani]|uniref:Uncharacterized protein n=1 Tax=Rhizoctonia solani TaxID=456999 RepID=A0A8H8P271_9AGAM|nr:uncharacterized protein RhiXN_08046 [Rhizoctonia solani]QRW23010.1 hypothetical protein RhiXN_08046 [Rhizoctonia solani]
MSLTLLNRHALSSIRTQLIANTRYAQPLNIPQRNKSKKAKKISPTPLKINSLGLVQDRMDLQLRLFAEVSRPKVLECWVDASTKNGLVAVVIGNTYKTSVSGKGGKRLDATIFGPR